MAAITRLGLYGCSRAPYGSFSGKAESTLEADYDRDGNWVNHTAIGTWADIAKDGNWQDLGKTGIWL